MQKLKEIVLAVKAAAEARLCSALMSMKFKYQLSMDLGGTKRTILKQKIEL